MKKKIINTLIIIGIALSVGLNLYFFGWRAIETKIQDAYLRGVADVNQKDIYLRGFNDAVTRVLNEAQQQGKVVINTPKGKRVLIPVDPNSIGGK